MSKRNIRARSGKQLYLNSVFNRGILYTASEIPEGYTKLLDNLDVTPSGDAVSPRSPFFKTSFNVDGLSKYTYPAQFQGSPDKQFYINFAHVVTEEDFVNDNINNDSPDRYEKQSINIYSRSNNGLNIGGAVLDTNNSDKYDPDYQLPDINISDPAPGDSIEILFGVERSAIISPVSYYNKESTLMPTSINTYNVIDADTVIINDTKYRLANINAPEKGYKWHEYGKQFLDKIMTVFSNRDAHFFAFNYGEDVYERTISDIGLIIGSEFTDDGQLFYVISLSSIVAAFGYAKLEFLNNSSIFFEELKTAEVNAKYYNYGVWGDEADPLYPGRTNIVLYDNLLNDADYDAPKYLEVVAIRKTKNINYDTTNSIDKVMHCYIDYMDSLAFIGRIIINDKIYYKGIIYLVYEKDNNTIYFKITLPPNKLEGDYVNIANATSNGYNLLNKNPINTNNISNKTLPTSCLGIAVVDPNNYNRIISQTIPGNEVVLRAIMNESYYPVKEINPFTYKLHYLVNGRTYIVDVIDNQPISITPEKLNDITSFKVTLVSLDIIYKNYDQDQTYNLPLNSPTYTIMVDESNTVTETPLKNFVIGEYGGTASIEAPVQLAKNGLFKDLLISISFSKNLFSNLYIKSTKEVFLQTKWEVANYGSTDFKVIDSFKKSYLVNKDTSNTVTRLSTNNDTIKYRVISDSNLIFKYTLVPLYRINIAGIGIISSSNKVQETYNIYPLLRISTSVEFIDKESLTTNINIKDATRIGVFNRQVYLYGPYIKTNTIFFSKFEEPWYFSFPYYAIDTKERINYCYEWNSNLVLFGEYSIWLLKTDGTVNESTIYNIYDKLSIHDVDIDLVTSVGNNLIFFNNNNGYIAVSNKYYDDPTKINIYKLTENINNCLEHPKYLYRSLSNTPLIDSLKDVMRCTYKIYVDNDYIVIINNMFYNNNNLIVFYRYNQLYKYWSTYSINTGVEYISSSYICEPNFGMQYIINNKGAFNVLYMNASESSKMDYGTQKIVSTLDTGFLSIDPLNDKRFKDVILDLNNIQKDSVINVYMNFFIDGIPITLSDNNDTAEFEYTNNSNPPVFKEGDYAFKYVLDVNASDAQEQPYGSYIEEPDYAIKVQGRNQLRIPVFGKGRLPSIVFKIDSDKSYEIVGYSIIYKEKNINVRR